eukprot:scaffold3292_cov120-Cylindrotheca_fusiformis.AAC.1
MMKCGCWIYLVALFQLYSAVNADRSSVASRMKATTPAATLPRGGWLGGGNAASDRYRESLEEEVLELDRQLRKARDEVAQLRARKKTTTIVSNTSPTTTIVEDDKLKLLNEKIGSLTQEIETLKSTKDELEAEQRVSQKRINELEQLLAEQQDDFQQQKAKFEQDMQALQSTTNERTAQQVSEMEYLLKEKVAQAINDTRQEAEKEMSLTIDQLKKELRTSHTQELEAERQRSMEAVESEKKKMRKLVKALAIREKKLAQE